MPEPSIRDLREATPENWLDLYGNANNANLVEVLSLGIRGTYDPQCLARTSNELYRRWNTEQKARREAHRLSLWVDRAITVFVAVATTLVTLYFSSSNANAASFDCNKAIYPIEGFICESNKLAELDKEMANVYFSLRESDLPKPLKDLLLDEQREWLAERTDKCPLTEASAEKCLIKLYEERIAFFKVYAKLPADLEKKPSLEKKEDIGAAPAFTTPVTQSAQLDYAKLYEKLSPAISVVLASQSYERFFEEDNISQGSGIAISPSFVLTNCHVIEGQKAFIVLQGGEPYAATLDSGRYYADLCILKIDDDKLKNYLSVSSLKSSSQVRVGQPVLAIGSPRGLENTLSTGIVSGIRRGERVTLLQTTTPISHGSSGGGLFDADGNLIGVTTLQYNDAQALNFAVSIDHLDLPK